MKLRSLALGAILCIASASQASLTFAEIAQWSLFSQTSDSEPVAAVNHGFTARIFSNSNGEVGSATVAAPDSSVYNLAAGSFVSEYSDFGFGSMAAVSAQYGAGAYDFTMTSGPLSGATDTVNYAGAGTFSENPYIDNLSAALALPLSSARTFTWSTTYTTTATFTGRQTYFTLRDVTANTTVFNSSGAPGSFGSATLAGNTLIAGHQYSYALTYGALDQVRSTAGFSPAFLTGTTYYQTTGSFTAVPEPGTMAVLGLGLAVAARRRRK